MRIAFAVLMMLTAVARSDEEDTPAKCDVRIIHALKDGSGIDPKITRLRPYLEQAPFSSWHHFKLLEDKQLDLKPHGGKADFDLPNGRKATLTYVDHFTQGKEHRMRLQLAIDRAEKQMLNTTFVLDEDGVVLQVGQKYENGKLILGISCKTEK
jgi:hypothetical protein